MIVSILNTMKNLLKKIVLVSLFTAFYQLANASLWSIRYTNTTTCGNTVSVQVYDAFNNPLL